MKKILLSIASSLMVFGLIAQSLVGTSPTQRVAVIEDYTGINCTWCPAGAEVADQLKAKYPGQIIAMGVHSGGYANTSGIFPDLNFKTIYGDYLNVQAQPTGYPNGSVNRIGLAMGRGSWESASLPVMAETSPVNVGVEVFYNPGSQEITINVELYYTSNVGTSQWLHIAILQDNVEANQIGMSRYPARVQTSGLYLHMDNLRDYPTGYFGEEITSTNLGELVTKTYTWNISSAPKDGAGVFLVDPKIEDLKVVVFTTKTGTYSEIVSAAEAHAQERPVGINEAASLEGLNIYPNPFANNTTIEFNLADAQNITLTVYDVTGKVVQNVSNTFYGIGNHKINIDGSNLENGLYYVSIVAEDGVITRKLILDK